MMYLGIMKRNGPSHYFASVTTLKLFILLKTSFSSFFPVLATF